MQRITISLDDDLLEAVDAMCEKSGYASRSEAMRDIIRTMIRATAKSAGGAKLERPTCFAALSYVYDHRTRELARRLTDSHHDHHRLSVATTHIHVDPESCLEVAILQGSQAEIEQFAQAVIRQRGVRHGHLNLIPLST